MVLRVEESDANGNTEWRDATMDDLAEIGVLNLAPIRETQGIQLTSSASRKALP